MGEKIYRNMKLISIGASVASLAASVYYFERGNYPAAGGLFLICAISVLSSFANYGIERSIMKKRRERNKPRYPTRY